MHKTLILALLVVFGCKNTKNAANESMDYKSIIEQNLGSNYESFSQGDLVLCYTIDKKNMTNWKSVLVINSLTGELIYGPEKLNANISWYADKKLLIKETPEVVKDKNSSDTYSYVYNLDTKQKESTTR